MAITKLENLINPEVMADMISAKIENAIVVTPFAKVDTTLADSPVAKSQFLITTISVMRLMFLKAKISVTHSLQQMRLNMKLRRRQRALQLLTRLFFLPMEILLAKSLRS